jgi:DNA-binding beta-propeller fold protein YncE
MHHEFAPSQISRKSLEKGIVAASFAFTLVTACTAEPAPRSVPAEFVRGLALPGTLDQFKRPAAITVDANTAEIFVADASNNRIVIFDANGSYRFEFGGRDDFATPLDVAVDSQGFIYVLGTTKEGNRIQRYDFDGTTPHAVQLPELDSADARIGYICIDEEDRLFLLETTRGSIFILSREGELLSSFELDAREESGEETDAMVGSLHANRGLIYVPISSYGTVQVYDLEGTLVRSLGHQGNNIGELNFPVAVTVRDDGMVMVLDKHRFNVLCFAQEGNFLGEFGGKGMRPGWFYYPTLLAVDTNGLVYIGQILGHRVDVCRIPNFILDAHSRSAEMGAALPRPTPLRAARTIPSTQHQGGVYRLTTIR